MTRVEIVRGALEIIYNTYRLEGESGTETLLHLLDNAVVNVNLQVQEAHEKEGLFTDCLSALASELDSEFIRANSLSTL